MLRHLFWRLQSVSPETNHMAIAWLTRIPCGNVGLMKVEGIPTPRPKKCRSGWDIRGDEASIFLHLFYTWCLSNIWSPKKWKTRSSTDKNHGASGGFSPFRMLPCRCRSTPRLRRWDQRLATWKIPSQFSLKPGCRWSNTEPDWRLSDTLWVTSELKLPAGENS